MKGGIATTIKNKVSLMVGLEGIQKGATYIAKMWNVVSPFRSKSGRTETFEAAARRVGADSQSLMANRKVFIITSSIHTVATLGGAVMAISKFSNGASGGFALMGFVSVNAALALTFAFRAWQIQQKRLGGFSEFMNGGR